MAHMPILLAVEVLRSRNREFKASLIYSENLPH